MTHAPDIRIRPCGDSDRAAIFSIVNDAAEAYRGVIPADRWHEPYMARQELADEIAGGVRFWCAEDVSGLLGVMGIQDVRDVTLVRHAYVLTAEQGRGIGRRLLEHLLRTAEPGRRVLVGTWADAWWAVRFYEKHGFALVTSEEKDRLLREYWTISDRQVETSVVLEQGAPSHP